jgi:hypothetical protein
MKTDFGHAFCGGGPATVGAFVCAARTGRLDELLEAGVLVIERGQRLGGGSLRHYGISSNSLAVAFLEGLDEIQPGGQFDDVRSDPATEELRTMSGVHAPLSLAGAYLDALGATVETILDEHPACEVARETRVRELRIGEDGITIAGENGVPRSIAVKKAVIAMGGRAPAGVEQLTVLPGLTLERYRYKVRHAAALFDDRIGLPEALLDAVRTTGRVTIVGGSHSAWSVAWLLMNDAKFRTDEGGPPTVTVLHRSPIRLFYLTTEDAVAEHYPFDPDRDVCPVSGRVNRVAGLKGDARELARQALGVVESDLPIHLLPLGRNGPDAAVAALDDAGLIVAATGYEPQLPALVSDSREQIVPAKSTSGLVVSDELEVVDTRGRALPGVLAYGLGVGIRAPTRVGGEPSNERAITSVWLYQHDVGQVALNSLLGIDDIEAHSTMPALTPGALGSGF